MSFRDIRGQEKAVGLIQTFIRNNRLSHAYLFVGPGSIGKGLAAKTLAKTLNCQSQQLDSCDECPSCRKIDKDIHPDVNWILPEGAGNVIKIEKIRWLMSNIGLKPYEGKAKFYIIDKADRMNDEASNSLLKTLEEPPPNSFLILISEKLQRLFYTITSRCQIIRFTAMNSGELEKILRDKYNLSPDLSHFLAYYSGGRIGRALTLRDEKTLEWKNEVIDKFAKRSVYFDEEEFLSDKDKEKILDALNILAIWYRDILVLKNIDNTSLLINRDRIDELASEAAKFSSEYLFVILDEIKKAGLFIEQNVNPKLTLSSLASRTGAPHV